jgi:anti-anti-sigma regulatory factor
MTEVIDVAIPIAKWLRYGAGEITFDFKKTKIVSSRFVGILIKCKKAHGKNMKMVNIHGSVLKMFKIMGLDELFKKEIIC